MRYVIIGAGPAGVTAAETLRQRDPDGEILIVGDEPQLAYSRMAIPYLLAGQIDERGTRLRHDPDHFERLRIVLRQDRVDRIDSGARRLALASGAEIDYDRLLLASGSRAVAPPIDSLDRPGIHHCWTLEDARAIAERARPGARVVLLGGGFIGCIIMEALARRDVRLTLVEMADRLVPRMMDETAGGLIKQWCIDQGVDVRTGVQVTAVDDDPDGAPHRLQCDDGTVLPADLIVVATGVRPAIDYLDGSGVEIGRGVRVDRRQQTSVAEIYAAGDVCEGFDWSSGERAVLAIQPAAVESARVAALNMAGGAVEHAGNLAMNVLDTLGLISTSCGRWMGVEGGDSAEQLDADGFRYLRLQFDGDRLVGSITLGTTEHVGVLRGLIQSRVRLGEWKARLMRNPGLVMEAWLAAAHPASG